MVLNMEEIGGLPKAWGLVELSHVSPDVGVVNHPLLVTLDDMK